MLFSFYSGQATLPGGTSRSTKLLVSFVTAGQSQAKHLSAFTLKKTPFALILCISNMSIAYSMEMVPLTSTTHHSCRAVECPQLPSEIRKLIFREYFHALGSNFEAIKGGLGILMEAFSDCRFDRRTDILRLLVDICGPENITALVLACEVSNRPGVIEWIQQYPDLRQELLVACAGTTPLISALRSPSPETAALIISLDPRATILRNDTGYTPLMAAASQNNCTALRALLEKGAVINATDDEGFTALHRAVERGFTEAAEVLLSSHADPNIHTKKDGFTPLYIALLIRNKALLTLLLGHKANPNLGTAESITPLMHVLYAYHQVKKEAKEGYQEQLGTLEALLMQLLKSRALKINKPGRFGVSPLGKAQECGLDSTLITAFIARGAQLSAQEISQAQKAQNPQKAVLQIKGDAEAHRKA